MSDRYRPLGFDPTDAELAATYDELPLWSAPFGLKLLDEVRLGPRLSALDVGCGTGFPLVELAQRLGPGARVRGIDPWEAGVTRCRQKLARAGALDAEVTVGTAEALPWPDESFDLIVSNNGLNNVADPDAAFAACYRVAKRGAQLVFTMNLPESMHEIYALLREVLADHGLHDRIAAIDRHIAALRPTRAATEARARAGGFRVDRVLEDRFALRYANGAALFAHAFVRLAFLGGWRGVVGERDVPAVFSRLEARLDALAEARGHVTLTIPFACYVCSKPAQGTSA